MRPQARSVTFRPTSSTRILALHVAIIMDGNGRWAQHRRIPRTFGHRAGAQRVEECVRAAPDIGITCLTLYAFSTENWKRSAYEVSSIFRLMRVYLRRKAEELRQENVRVRFIGRRTNLAEQVLMIMNWVENLTANCNGLQLNIAVDYGGRNELIRIIDRFLAEAHEGGASRTIDEAAVTLRSDLAAAPPLDLVIRTGGERRISNFLLWHLAYSELEFVDKLWPDFSAADLERSVNAFRSRNRRFGAT